MTNGIYNRKTGDCAIVREYLLTINSNSYGDDEYVDEILSYVPGRIWMYVKYDTFDYGYGFETVDYITAVYNLTGSRNMGSTISFVKSGDYIGVVPIYITIQNTDGSIENLTYNLYTQGYNYELAFYLCGCNASEIVCGDCCVNCCDIARSIKENYENILL